MCLWFMRILYIRNQLYMPYLSYHVVSGPLLCACNNKCFSLHFNVIYYMPLDSMVWSVCFVWFFVCHLTRSPLSSSSFSFSSSWSVVIGGISYYLSDFWALCKAGKMGQLEHRLWAPQQFQLACIAGVILSSERRMQNRMCFPLLFCLVSDGATVTLYYLTFQQNNCR